MIHHGDCIEVMATLPEASVDAIVTDPPYGLEFMGKEWDKLKPQVRTDRGGRSVPGRSARDDAKSAPVEYGHAPRRSTYTCDACGKRDKFKNVHGCPVGWSSLRLLDDVAAYARAMGDWHARWAEAAYRVAKPSAYLLAFGGTRTVHRMTCALEDAGWIIRDMLVWGYASGFPKSKASLKPAWEPIVMARKPGPLRMLAIDECRIGTDTIEVRRSEGEDGTSFPRYGRPPGIYPNEVPGRWPANIVLTDPIFDGGIEGVVGGGEARGSVGSGPRPLAGMFGPMNNNEYGDTGTYSRFFLVPKSSRSDREPVLDEYAYRLHRERGECDKLSAWANEGRNRSEQTGSTSPARAISEAMSTADSSSDTSQHGSQPTGRSPRATKSTTSTATSRTTGSTTSSSSIPSPTSASIPAANSETDSGGNPAEPAVNSSLWEPPTGISVLRAGRSMDDADPATSRSWSSRNVCARCGRPLPRVATHPTQKPTELMRHLVRLVTPTGGVVLDPFLGSGTTALAAEMEGFEWIGIEREAEYVAIAEARLNGTQRGLGLEVG